MLKTTGVLEKGIAIFLSLILLGILVLDIMFQNVNYFCKKDFLLPNIILLPISLLVSLSVSVIIGKNFEHSYTMKENSFTLINSVSVLLFLLLLYIALNIYFFTGWDAGVVINNARALARGEAIDVTYFSRYPNNQLLLLVETLLSKINNNWGVIDTSEGVIILIAFQCLLISITGNFLFKIIIEYTENRYYAWMGWIIFCMLLAFSGWVTIPYTDGMAIVYPVLILWCYQKKNHSKGNKTLIWWTIIAILSYWGFKMKPTVLIMLIAIICGEFLYGIRELNKGTIKKCGSTILVIFAVFIVSSGIFQSALDSTGVVINKEQDVGALHFIMMGLKNDRDGVWDADDVNLSQGIPTKKERTETQINTIKQRVKEYGLNGLLRHIARKLLVIFNDGSFAWGVEGGFYTQIYAEKNGYISPALRDIFYNSGNSYKTLATIEQALWLLTLLLSGLCCFVKKDKFLTIMITSLLGIVFFNLLSEARARYVMIYVPIFIIVAMICLRHLCDWIVKKCNHSGSGKPKNIKLFPYLHHQE